LTRTTPFCAFTIARSAGKTRSRSAAGTVPGSTSTYPPRSSTARKRLGSKARASNQRQIRRSSCSLRQWQAPNGELRTEIAPKGNAAESTTIGDFAQAVLSVVPDATGPAIEIYQWGKTVTDAFIKAGVIAICSIAIILFVALRRIRDVLLTLIPLWVAAAATLEICALSGFALNYANIIALPALLGVGVAFKIYYVTAWRRGEYNFLESTLTHAVFYSAVMTATAFGSLWFSAHPGISSMGKLLALSLACTLASAALFQPALMGPPRTRSADAAADHQVRSK